MFRRAMVFGGDRLPQPMRVGDGLIANPSVFSKTDDADATLSVDEVLGGFIQQAGTLTAGRTLTTPTATALAAALDGMDVGDGFCFVVSNANAGDFAVTIAGGTDVTLVGSGAIPQFGSRMFCLVKTGAATFSLY